MRLLIVIVCSLLLSGCTSAAVETDPAKLVGKAATVSELPGTVATGVPTRIATGKPEPVAIETPAVVAAPVAPIPRPACRPIATASA